MTKQLYKLTLFVVLLSLFLAACQPAAAPVPAQPTAAPTKEVAAPTAEPAKPTEPPAAPAPTEPPAKAEPVDLELWVGAAVSEGGPPPDDWAAYDIVRDKLGINLKVVLLPTAQTDADAKINAAGAANSLPDLFQVNREPWYRLVQNGLVAEVDDLLPQMPNRTQILYTDDIRNRLVTLDGKMYGLPQPGALPRTDALVIRKDWLDKLGLEMPKTLEDFLAVAKAFTEQDPDGNGKKDTYGFCGYIESEQMGVLSGLGKRFEWVFGAYGVNGAWNLTDANFGLNVRNPNYMKAVDYIRQLNEAGVVDPDWPTLKKDEFRARWKQGSCGIMNENFAALSTKANYADFDKNFPDGEWVVLPPPTGPDGKSSQGVDVRNVRIFAMSQKAKEAGKAEAIAKLLEWMSGDEGYYLLGFGQEGINYKKDDKGFVTTKGIEPPENAYTHKSQQPLTQLRNMVFNNNEIELNARYVPYKTAKERDMNPLAYFKAYGEQPWTEATGWMVINPPPGGADFTRFYSENLVKFALGQQPINEQTWTEFVNGLDGLGAKDYEVQAKETLQNSGFLP